MEHAMEQQKTTPDTDSVAACFKQALSALGISYEQVFLFGSQARGCISPDSDWDFFVVVPGSMSGSERRKTRAKLRLEFHKQFRYVPIDIIIKEAAEFESEKTQLNTLAHEVAAYGVAV